MKCGEESHTIMKTVKITTVRRHSCGERFRENREGLFHVVQHHSPRIRKVDGLERA